MSATRIKIKIQEYIDSDMNVFLFKEHTHKYTHTTIKIIKASFRGWGKGQGAFPP